MFGIAHFMSLIMGLCHGLDYIGDLDVMKEGGYENEHWDMAKRYYEKMIAMTDLSEYPSLHMDSRESREEVFDESFDESFDWPEIDPFGITFDLGSILPNINRPNWVKLLELPEESSVAVLEDDGDMTGLIHFENVLAASEYEKIYNQAAVLCVHYEGVNGKTTIFRGNGFYIDETHIVTARHNVYEKVAFVGKTNLHPINYEKFSDDARIFYGIYNDYYTLKEVYVYRATEDDFCGKKRKIYKINVATDIERCDVDNGVTDIGYWLNKNFLNDVAVIKSPRILMDSPSLPLDIDSNACKNPSAVMVVGIAPKFMSPFFFQDGSVATPNELNKFFHSNRLTGSITDEFEFGTRRLVLNYNATTHGGYSGSMTGVICDRKFHIAAVHSGQSGTGDNHGVHFNHPFLRQVMDGVKSEL